MHRKTRTLYLLIALVLLAAFAASGHLAAQDIGIQDTVRIDTTASFVAGDGSVPIYFFNDEELLGLEVTVRQPSPLVKIDSFSFAGSRVATLGFKNVRISSDSSIITMSAVGSSSTVPAGSGLFGHLWLSYPSSITPQTVPIEPITWKPEPSNEYTTQFFLQNVTAFVPAIIPGALVIEENPPTADSVWIPDMEAYPGQPLAVNVYVYNERPVKDVSLALLWGSAYLHFDSARYQGMRADVASTKSVQSSNPTHQLLATVQFGEATPLPTGTGLFMQLFFSVDTSPDTNLVIDTTTFLGVQNSFFNLTSIDGNAQITPRYREGLIHVNAGTEVDETDPTIPVAYNLGQNYPNPFNPSTRFEFALPRASHVRIDVYDILGRTVRTLMDKQLSAGEHVLVFDGRNGQGEMLATGVYFYRMATESYVATKKMLLLK